MYLQLHGPRLDIVPVYFNLGVLLLNNIQPYLLLDIIQYTIILLKLLPVTESLDNEF